MINYKFEPLPRSFMESRKSDDNDGDVQHVLDTRGLFCPEPVMQLHGIIRNIAPGEVVKVVATDPTTSRDIPRFCEFLKHELILSDEVGPHFVYHIRKSA